MKGTVEHIFFKSECDIGLFGEGCAKRCSVHCAGSDNTCNNVNGTCNMGCDPGYKGSLCIQSKSKPTERISVGTTVLRLRLVIYI